MSELLVLADDFTGALDTGVQFTKVGLSVQVCTVDWNPVRTAPAQVAVVNTQTRHLSPQQAATIVRDVVRRAKDSGIRWLYKKTDSALRGNIGSELTAFLEASGEAALYFVPAYPQSGRTTLDGIHYVDGQPVADSVFGSDPFEPVTHSYVAEIIAQQSDVPVTVVPVGGPLPAPNQEKGIYVFDARTDSDLAAVAHFLARRPKRPFAGCAGLAGFLPGIWDLPKKPLPPVKLPCGLVAVSGSVNPITVAQVAKARAAGIPCLTLTDRQKTDPEYPGSESFEAFLQEVVRQFEMAGDIILEAVSSDGIAPGGYRQPSLPIEEDARQQVARNIGAIAAALIKKGLPAAYMLVGGDTLQTAMSNLGESEITPLAELSHGVVLSRMTHPGGNLIAVTKSGGLGEDNVFANLSGYLKNITE